MLVLQPDRPGRQPVVRLTSRLRERDAREHDGPERVVEHRRLLDAGGRDHVDRLRHERRVERAVRIGARGGADAELERPAASGRSRGPGRG